jgi:hypothetical protein
MTTSPGDGALGSVLGLERALESEQATAAHAETRIEQARQEAEALLVAARERAGRRSAERKSSVIAAAEAEARAARGEADAAAARLRAKADAVEAAFVDAALALLLPAAKQEATCSSR